MTRDELKAWLDRPAPPREERSMGLSFIDWSLDEPPVSAPAVNRVSFMTEAHLAVIEAAAVGNCGTCLELVREVRKLKLEALRLMAQHHDDACPWWSNGDCDCGVL